MTKAPCYPGAMMQNDPAAKLNEVMGELYDRRCREFAYDFPVVLHLEDTDLVLRWGSRRTEAPNRYRESYDLLKNISHLPLAVYLCFADGNEAHAHRDLATLRPHLREILPRIDLSPLDEEEKSMQRRILAQTELFLSAAPSAETMPAYVRALDVPIQFNIARAAELRIRGLHEQMEIWAREMGAAAFSELRVVIATSHMARRENLPELYFDWLFKGEGEAKRIFKVEGIDNEEESLRHFGLHLVDAGIGRIFFGQPSHMHRDLLSPPVPEILKKLTRFVDSEAS